MRTFIAVDLDGPSREAVSGLVRGIAGALPGVRWVRADNIHVTIKFLGETSPEVCALVERALEDVARNTAPFKVSLGGLGAFPGLRRPRVLWVGIDEGKEELRRFHARLEKKLEAIEIHREGRSYTPHVTIGRVRRPARDEILAGAARDSCLRSSFVADKVVFIESKLTPRGAVYRTICEAPMKGKRPE